MADLLIVDDDKESRDLLCAFLTDAQHKVRSVSNGKEALQAVLERAPDLVILDIFMPEMDGPTFLEILRSYLRLQSLPVIIHTGLPDSPAIDHARFLKVNTILVKTKVSFEEILQAVATELHRVPN